MSHTDLFKHNSGEQRKLHRKDLTGWNCIFCEIRKDAIINLKWNMFDLRLDVNQSLILTGQNNDCWSSWSLQGSVKLWLFLSRVTVGRREPLRSHVEGQLRPHPDCSRGRSSADRAGTEAGGPTPHALRPLVLEGLQETQGTSLWTLDIVSDSCLITFFFFCPLDVLKVQYVGMLWSVYLPSLQFIKKKIILSLLHNLHH